MLEFPRQNSGSPDPEVAVDERGNQFHRMLPLAKGLAIGIMCMCSAAIFCILNRPADGENHVGNVLIG